MVCTAGMAGLFIGDVAQRAGVSAPTIRYYESVGLLTAPRRTAAGYRRYSDTTVDELRFIKKAQGLGFSLDEVGEILTLTRSGEAPCAHVLSVGHRHLAAVQERIRQLQRFQELLGAELAKWEQQETAVTCRGSCQFIAEADAGTVAPATVTFRRPPKQSATRPRPRVHA
jgi:MerR family transcriptional regulator, copper efflux regulator